MGLMTLYLKSNLNDNIASNKWNDLSVGQPIARAVSWALPTQRDSFKMWYEIPQLKCELTRKKYCRPGLLRGSVGVEG
jgi:hypothetical protein